MLRLMLDRIAAWFGFVRISDEPREYPRVSNGVDAIARGQRWESFYREQDGLGDMLTKLRQSYFEKVGSTKPGDTQTLLVLGLADKIVREVEREVQTVIETGKMRANDREHAERVARVGKL